MAPDLTAFIDLGQGITQVFHERLLFDSFCHDYGKVFEGGKLRSQVWIDIMGDFIYIFS